MNSTYVSIEELLQSSQDMYSRLVEVDGFVLGTTRRLPYSGFLTANGNELYFESEIHGLSGFVGNWFNYVKLRAAEVLEMPARIEGRIFYRDQKPFIAIENVRLF